MPSATTHGALVADLTLGFWVHLTDRSHDVELWRSGLYLAWPKGTNRTFLQQRLDGILRMRNRIVHEERLFNPKTEGLLPAIVDANVLQLLRLLCPQAYERPAI